MKYLIIIFLMPFSCLAQLSLPHFFSDGMVFQQRSEVAIWGSDSPGSTILVAASWNKTAKVKADQNGKWKVKIATPSAGGPYTLNIKGSTNQKLKDVLIGEVWFCSGQSNMERTLSGKKNEPVENSSEMIANSSNNMIRVFTVAKKSSTVPLDDVAGEWLSASPATSPKFSAVAYAYAKKLQDELKIPVGIIVCSWGGSSVEAWMEQSVIKGTAGNKLIAKASQLNRTPSLLYNGMLHPFLGYGIRGAIWYQGEANVPNAESYQAYFSNMIKSWRSEWKSGDFPFYFVQIAPFDYGKFQSGPLRDAQRKVLMDVPKTGMAVTLDLGMCSLIHPPKKKEVGERLANWALAKTYGMKAFAASGPIFKSVKSKAGGKMLLEFDAAEKGLKIASAEITGFEIAGSDRKFQPAQLEVGINGTLKVWSDAIQSPVAVRYAYANCAEGTLFNSAGLPAGTFRTDDW